MIQKLTGISETLLIPLWARVVETKKKDSVVKDYKAVKMVEKIIWYNLDLTEPIRIKKKFFEETERYKMISKSVLDYS